MQQKLPIVALVGPPNVGKSTLLNKIVKQQMAVTSRESGTTRDRQYSQTSFDGVNFILVDTAGLNSPQKKSASSTKYADEELESNVQKQIEAALKEADLIIMVIDGKKPARAIEQNILSKFRKLKTPKILAVNKLDSPKNRDRDLVDFAVLGIKPFFGVSAVTGAGIGDMLEYITAVLKKRSSISPITNEKNPAPTALETKKEASINVAIVGKPNVGKSSIFNAILKKERAVVSKVPGTTRSAIDENIIINGIDYTFIDTAGLKRRKNEQSKPDIYSGFQTFKSIRRSDICIFVIDAIEPITFQDQRIAQEIIKMKKGCIIIANKIDLYRGSKKSLENYISSHFPFLWMCPVFFVSAVAHESLNEAVKAIYPIFQRRNKKIDSQQLSEFLQKKMEMQPPKRLWDQKIPKVFALSQYNVNPPTFELLVNFPAAISQHFRHFLENKIIQNLDFYGTPIELYLKRKIGR